MATPADQTSHDAMRGANRGARRALGCVLVIAVLQTTAACDEGGDPGAGGAGGAGAGALAAGAGGASGEQPRDAGHARDAGSTIEDAGMGLQPVVIIRGDPAQAEWWDLTVRGVDLERHDGAIANVRIGHPDRPPERLGSAQALVAGGSFELTFPRVWEATLYKLKAVFIDVDRDGVCEPSEPVFGDARAAAPPDFVLTVRGGDATARNDFHRSGDPAADCAELNAPWPPQ